MSKGLSVKQAGHGDFVALQIRIRETMEPDLYAFVMSLPPGKKGEFVRDKVLVAAMEMGLITPNGLAMRGDDQVHNLQAQLQILREDNARLEARLQMAGGVNAAAHKSAPTDGSAEAQKTSIPEGFAQNLAQFSSRST